VVTHHPEIRILLHLKDAHLGLGECRPSRVVLLAETASIRVGEAAGRLPRGATLAAVALIVSPTAAAARAARAIDSQR